MGYLVIDDRVSGKSVREYSTVTCEHCGKLIVYASKLIGNFLRKVRTSFNKITGERVEQIGKGYWCPSCNGEVCAFCGDLVFNSDIRNNCRSGIRVANAITDALAHHVDTWSRQGKLYIENLINKKVF